jgi:hypothetical protein
VHLFLFDDSRNLGQLEHFIDTLYLIPVDIPFEETPGVILKFEIEITNWKLCEPFLIQTIALAAGTHKKYVLAGFQPQFVF